MAGIVDIDTARCPVEPGRDDRKSNRAAVRHDRQPTGSARLTRFGDLRAMLRSTQARQAMPGGEACGDGSVSDQLPVAYLSGEAHKARRAAVARYFTPRAVTGRYETVIVRTCDALIRDLRTQGTAKLDVMSFELAAMVVAEVVGLTASDTKGMSRRLRRMLESGLVTSENAFKRAIGKLVLGVQLQNFYAKDVKPALDDHRRAPREDVLSYMIEHGWSKRAMLVECFVYGMAGMTTTRELMTMGAWHLFDDPALKARFLEGTEAEQLAIVDEILRIEPVGGMIYRRIDGEAADGTGSEGQGTPDGPARGSYALDIRAANLDEAVVGACPHAIDPGRAKRQRLSGNYMSFGDGPHRCPGAQLALHETRIFLDRVMRVPGLALARPPRMEWNSGTMGYELRDVAVTCDRV